MMGSKAIVFAVAAVALGYLLISVIPNQLVSFQERQLGEIASSESITVEPPAPKASEPDALEGEKTFADSKEPAEAAKSRADEAKVSSENLGADGGTGIGWDLFSTLGMWGINLLIALGIYFLVKRRL